MIIAIKKPQHVNDRAIYNMVGLDGIEPMQSTDYESDAFNQ